MSQKKTVFSNVWLTCKKYATWLHAVPANRNLAGCRLCYPTFSLSNMGKQALTSHMKSKKHLNAEKSLKSCPTVKSMMNKDASSQNQNLTPVAAVETLSNLNTSVLARFVKTELMGGVLTIIVFGKKNLKHPKDIDVGYAVRAAL